LPLFPYPVILISSFSRQNQYSDNKQQTSHSNSLNHNPSNSNDHTPKSNNSTGSTMSNSNNSNNIAISRQKFRRVSTGSLMDEAGLLKDLNKTIRTQDVQQAIFFSMINENKKNPNFIPAPMIFSNISDNITGNASGNDSNNSSPRFIDDLSSAIARANERIAANNSSHTSTRRNSQSTGEGASSLQVPSKLNKTKKYPTISKDELEQLRIMLNVVAETQTDSNPIELLPSDTPNSDKALENSESEKESSAFNITIEPDSPVIRLSSNSSSNNSPLRAATGPRVKAHRSMSVSGYSNYVIPPTLRSNLLQVAEQAGVSLSIVIDEYHSLHASGANTPKVNSYK
jgi:hypothetical protein